MFGIGRGDQRRRRVAQFVLPWLGCVFTWFPFNRRLSLWLDRMTSLSEGEHGRHSDL